MNIDLIAGPLFAFLIGYGLGSIPFGILLTRAFGAGDLRSIGSGNIGATNVLRTGRKGLAVATLLLDMAKGTFALLIARNFFPDFMAWAAFGALIGHLYPVWLKFAGGKGVATYFGLVLGFCLFGGLHWAAAFAYVGSWLGLLAITRYSSVAGMSAALLAPLAAFWAGRPDLALLFLDFGLIVCWKHRANVGRLLAGTEPRIGKNEGSESL